MNYEACGNCIGTRQLSCAAARTAVRIGLEQLGGLDPDLQAEAALEMTGKVAQRIISEGCDFSIGDLQRQMVQ